MGLTIHWSFQGPKTKTDAQAIIEKMRQRAMDLPFEAVGEIVHFKGKDAQFDNDPPNGKHTWLKIQARETIWNKDRTVGWDCPAKGNRRFPNHRRPWQRADGDILGHLPHDNPGRG